MAQSKAQLDHQLSMRRYALAQQLGKYFFMSVCFCACMWSLVLCVKSLSGRATTASLLVSILGKLTASNAVPTTLMAAWAVAASIWGGLERTSKKKLIKRLHPLARQVQLKVDPNKGSSGITLSGDTGPEDV